MSRTEIYYPDVDDPNGRSPAQAGMQAGMQFGSMFGPTGTVVGALIGGTIGSLDRGARRRRRRAIRKATAASYEFAGNVYEYRQQNTENITRAYEINASSAMARAGAAGGGNNSSLQIGRYAIERDEALETLQTEVEGYREGPNYKWMMRDYERVTGIGAVGTGGKGDDTKKFYIGGGSNVGRSAFTDEQRKMLRTEIGSDPSAAYKAYAESIKPTIEEFETYQFGTDQEKADYEKTMTQRINRANAIYSVNIAIEKKKLQEQIDKNNV